MGNKDRTRDENAATSTDASRDQESRDAALARTIAIAVAGALMQQKAEETQSIAEAVALQTKSIIDAFSKQRQKRHIHSQKHSKGKWRRRMCSLMRF